MITIKNIKLKIDHTNLDLENKIKEKLKLNKNFKIEFEILKKAIDSRKKDNIHYVYNVKINVDNPQKFLKINGVELAKEYKYDTMKLNDINNIKSPIIVGAGPAGLLAGIVLAESGLKPIIIEQGKDVYERQKDINEFWETGVLNTSSNVQFGAGGAGTFSDGKLTTGVNDIRKAKLIEELIFAGAPEEIKYLSKPHLGTDILITVVNNMCEKIKDLGGEIKFNTKFLSFTSVENKIKSVLIKNDGVESEIECEQLILAIGHSSRDTFYKLHDLGIDMKPKSFAVGYRIEHLQNDVNISQYGDMASKLEAANYKLNIRSENRTCHTFCMCPGGVVVAAASEENRVVTNGMSYSKRDLTNSNSALLVNIKPEDYQGDENPLNGIEFQRKLEETAFKAGGSDYSAPVQKVGDFLSNTVSTEFKKVKPTYTPGTKSVNLNEHFPEFINETIKEAIVTLRERIAFLKDDEAVLSAIESRSSSPVTITRDENLTSNIQGILPCGEGAGYAGGIVSAAIDGIKCAEIIINNIKKETNG